ncbi:MAG: hypothetical protein B7Y35_06130 [Sphingomonadales bacterium 28-64-96]|nr:MAG: hypothetical protein B7Y35_06130 [Sphingomonadales bacterium 28-64-96]
MAVTLVQITAWDPVASAAVVVRACNVDDHRVTRLNGQRWWPVLARAPQRLLDLFDGDFSGQIGIGIGDLEISTAAHPNAARYSWGERAVTVWRGPLGGAWGDYSQVFTGLTRPASGSNGRLRIGLRPDDRWLDKPLLATYAGTGDAEGPAALKGLPKPLAFGAPQFVPGVLINSALNIWQLHGAGGVQAVPQVLDRLARFGGGAFAGNDANYAALAAATIPAGSLRTCLALGLVRFGAPPAVPSFWVEGDNGSAAGWVRRPGAIIKRIAEIAGATAGQINSTSLGALDTWAATLPGGGNLSLYLGEQTSARDIIQQIASSCNAAAGVGFDGRLFVARAGIGSPAFTLAADGSRTPAVADVQLLETSAPFWRHAIAAEPTWRVHSEGEYGVIGVADQITYPDGTTVSALQPDVAGATRNRSRGTYAAGTTYTRGDRVIEAGSTYELIVDSSTGNAPPDAARWVLDAAARSGVPGADGADGITVTATNQAHSVPTEADGSGGSYTSAGGTMILRRGATVLSPTFSIAAKSPNTSWITIDSSTGVYTVTDPGATLGTATLRANVGGVNYDLTYTITKTLKGVAGPNLTLVADGQAFTFTDGAANPGSQLITLTALLTNLTGTASFSTSPSVTLGGTGNTRTLALADFGANRQVTVEATLGGITDRITLVRLERNVVAANAANRVRYSEMEGERGWDVNFNPAGLSVAEVFGTFGGKRFFAGIATTTAAGQVVVIGQQGAPAAQFAVTPGERLSVQARVDAFGDVDEWNLSLWWVGADGSREQVSVASGLGDVFSNATDPQRNFVTAPATITASGSPVVGGYLDLSADSTGAGTMQLSFVRPMVAGAAPGQTVHPAYTKGPNAADGADVTRDTLPALNRGAWSGASVAYALGDIVTRSGSSYTCITAHTSTGSNGPPGANWALLADAGAQGPAGVSAPPIKALTTGAAQFDPIQLDNGQTVTVDAALFLNTGGTTGACTLEIQISVHAVNSWANLTGGSATDTQPTSEPVELTITGATFTNTSGITQLYDIRAVSERRSRSVNQPLSFMAVR